MDLTSLDALVARLSFVGDGGRCQVGRAQSLT